MLKALSILLFLNVCAINCIKQFPPNVLQAGEILKNAANYDKYSEMERLNQQKMSYNKVTQALYNLGKDFDMTTAPMPNVSTPCLMQGINI